MDTKQFFVTSEEMEQGFEDDGYDLPGSKRRFELDQSFLLETKWPPTDLVIDIGGNSWYAHRAVVCPRISFLVEEHPRLPEFGLVKLVEGDALAVHCMLEWIYTGDYEDDGYDYAEGYGGLRLNMLVLEVADMYKLPNLWRLARKKFTAFGSHMYLHPSFAEAVEILWTLPMKHEQCIRDSVLNICVAHATELFGDAEARQAIWSTNGRFGTATDPVELKGVYENMPRFASDLAARMAKKLQPVKVRPPRRGEERDDFRQKDPPAQPYPKAGVVVPLDKERLAKWAAFVFDKTGLTGM